MLRRTNSGDQQLHIDFLVEQQQETLCLTSSGRLLLYDPCCCFNNLPGCFIKMPLIDFHVFVYKAFLNLCFCVLDYECECLVVKDDCKCFGWSHDAAFVWTRLKRVLFTESVLSLYQPPQSTHGNPRGFLSSSLPFLSRTLA